MHHAGTMPGSSLSPLTCGDGELLKLPAPQHGGKHLEHQLGLIQALGRGGEGAHTGRGGGT